MNPFKSYFTKYIAFLLLISTFTLSASEAIKHRVGKGRNAFETNSWFVTKQSPLIVYSSLESEGEPNDTPLGTLYFAKDRQNGKVLLAQYHEAAGWNNELGWVDESDVLENLFHPLKLSDALQLELIKKKNLAANTMGGLLHNNEQFLKVIVSPTKLLRPGASPGEVGSETINVFSWFSVFDVKMVNGKFWVLIGKSADILPSRLVKNTQNQSTREILIGWLPLNEVEIWTSNLVLELNTSEFSVQNRMKKSRPATVYSEQIESSAQLYIEPMELLWGNDRKKTLIDFDPMGMSADIPRKILLSREEGWVEVGDVSHMGDQLKSPKSMKIQEELNRVADELSTLDLVFVISSTESMSEEVDAIKGFVDYLYLSLRMSEQKADLKDFGSLKSVNQIPHNFKISISLISSAGAKSSKVYLNKRRVLSDYNEIIETLGQLRGNLDDHYSGLSSSVEKAVEHDNLSSLSSNKALVLISDDVGKSINTDKILSSMPILKEDQINASPKLKQLSINEQKKQLTNIYSVFTGHSSEYKTFKTGVEEFSTEVKYVGGDSESFNRANMMAHLLDIVNTKRQSIFHQFQVFNRIMASQIASETMHTTLPGIESIALELAIESGAGLELSELMKQTDQIYYQGMIPVEDIEVGDIISQKNKHPKPYRLRYLLTTDELSSLQDTTSRIATGLSVAVEQILQGDDGLFDNADNSSKQLLIAQLLLLARDQIWGYGNYQNNKSKLLSHAKMLFKSIQTGRWSKDDSSFARLMKVPSSLPMKNDGFLSKPLKEIINYHPDELMTIADSLNLKQIGLQRIIDNQTVPEDFRLVMTAVTKQVKVWAFTNGTHSTVKYVYIPLSYIP
jgi:hypothetical protein